MTARTGGALLVAIVAGCGSQDHSHNAPHAEESGPAHAHEDSDYPAESTTIWTDAAELFMEWDALTVGRESRFVAHVTDLTAPTSFKAMASGTVTVTLSVQGHAPQSQRLEEPAEPGIFVPSLTPGAAGPCKLTVSLTSDTLSETFRVEPCVVHPDEASARQSADTADSTAGQIGFLKDQQWPIAFATAEARVRTFSPSATVNAQIKAVAGLEAKLTASTTGRLILSSPAPTIGSPVAKGDVLARIQPTVSGVGNLGALQADVTAAQAEARAAEATKARLARLVASDAVARRRLEDASAAVEVASARLTAARTRLSSYQASAGGTARATAGAFRITSPIDGTLVEQNVTEGETVSAGALLFSVIDLDRVWVEGRVFEADLARFENAAGAWFTVDGRADVFEIDGDSGRLVTIGHVLDPASRTVPVVYEVANPSRKLRIGQFAELSVATDAPRQSLVVPDTALLQDGNQTVAFVQVGGETFERRVVGVGARSRGMVEIRSGIRAGERVVTVGAYDVKLSSAGGAPAHGHAH